MPLEKMLSHENMHIFSMLSAVYLTASSDVRQWISVCRVAVLILKFLAAQRQIVKWPLEIQCFRYKPKYYHISRETLFEQPSPSKLIAVEINFLCIVAQFVPQFLMYSDLDSAKLLSTWQYLVANLKYFLMLWFLWDPLLMLKVYLSTLLQNYCAKHMKLRELLK